MRGRPYIQKREVLPDPKYGQKDLAKFINYVMKRGKKTLAQRIVYNALEIIKAKTKKDPLLLFREAIKNASPEVEVRPRRIGGSNYQIPVRVSEVRAFTLASRWILEAARSRQGKPMEEKLAEELLEAAQGRGAAIKKKEDVYRMAEANKAFAHFVSKVH